jgi:hypothetical protein
MVAVMYQCPHMLAMLSESLGCVGDVVGEEGKHINLPKVQEDIRNDSIYD